MVFSSAGAPRHTCPQCGKQYALKQSFRKHMQYHSEEKPFRCDVCGKHFREHQVLINHRRIHTGETMCWMSTVVAESWFPTGIMSVVETQLGFVYS